MASRPFDSLFARLMLAQTVLMVLVAMMFIASRSLVTAAPYAQLWAANLIEVVRQAPGAALLQASPGYPVQRQAAFPSGFKSHNLTVGPGFSRWQSEFALRGLAMDDIRAVPSASGMQFWFHAVQPGLDPVWLGLPAPPLLLFLSIHGAPLEPLMVLVFVGLSWWFTRHVTRDLKDLSRRMRSDVRTLDAATGLAAAKAQTSAGSSAEIRVIDHDYQQLLERLRIVELERALLLAGVSHDLRSPLARIRLATELLPERADPKPHIDAILRNIDHADQLIGSFLDFVRAGSLEMDEMVDVAAVVRAVVAQFERATEVLCMAPAPAQVLLGQVNGLLVHRLVFNLIDNGLLHGKAPVRVCVSAARDPAGSETVEVDVCDAGGGLPLGQEAVMLQAFARGDPSRNRPGSGLGLSIVRQAVARMGGTLAFTRDDSGHHARVRFVRRAGGQGHAKNT